MKDSKNLVIGMLCAVVCIMAVAYAAFSTTLNINGTASISSEWKVEIQSATCDFKAANELEASQKACTDGAKMCAEAEVVNESLTANVNMVFQQPGDEATCTIVYVNLGTLDATLEHEVVGFDAETGLGGTDAIKWTVTGTNGTQPLLAKNDSDSDLHKITIKGEYIDNEDGNSEPGTDAKKATLTIVSTASQKFN